MLSLSSIARGIFITYLIFALVITPLAGIYQECLVWNKKPSSSKASSSKVPRLNIIGYVKLYIFFVLWIGLCLMGSLLLLPLFLLSAGKSKFVEYSINNVVQKLTGTFLILALIGNVEIKGIQNLPPAQQPQQQKQQKGEKKKGCIYIANHSSTIDSGAVYFINRSFRWIAKKSIVYMPGVGYVMVMGNHVIIDRASKDSKRKLYEKCYQLLDSGENIFIYPQGTRCLTKWLPFKDGAFNMAIEGKYKIVPISIDIPRNTWNSLYPLKKVPNIVLTVHPMVHPTTTTNEQEGTSDPKEEKEKLKQKCEQIILSALPHFLSMKES